MSFSELTTIHPIQSSRRSFYPFGRQSRTPNLVQSYAIDPTNCFVPFRLATETPKPSPNIVRGRPREPRSHPRSPNFVWHKHKLSGSYLPLEGVAAVLCISCRRQVTKRSSLSLLIFLEPVVRSSYLLPGSSYFQFHGDGNLRPDAARRVPQGSVATALLSS